MSELIRSQLLIAAVMICCGLCSGMIHQVFRSFEVLRNTKSWQNVILEGIYFVCMGFLYSEFSLYCDNGKLTFLGIFSFLSGLWLWRRFFCGILFMGEDDEKKKEMEDK